MCSAGLANEGSTSCTPKHSIRVYCPWQTFLPISALITNSNKRMYVGTYVDVVAGLHVECFKALDAIATLTMQIIIGKVKIHTYLRMDIILYAVLVCVMHLYSEIHIP